jgi:hypothetical protein
MDTIDGCQFEKVLKDIPSIKSVINKNKPLLQQVLNPAHFRLFTLLAAISIIGFALPIYFLMQQYVRFSAIPRMIRYITFAAMAADWVFMQFLKQRTFLKTGKRIDPTFTIRRLLKEFFAYRIAHVYVPMTLLIIFLNVFFIQKNIPYYIVPTCSIGIGLLYNFIGSFIEIRQYLILGYWFLVTGAGVLIFNTLAAPVSLSLTLGGGLLIFSALGYFAASRVRED